MLCLSVEREIFCAFNDFLSVSKDDYGLRGGSTLKLQLIQKKLLCYSQIASIATRVCPLYLATQVDNATVGWRLNGQVTLPLPALKKYSAINPRVSRSPTES